MPQYRLYRLDPDTGHNIGLDNIQARDDDAAIREVRHRNHDVPVELWEDGRKVCRIAATLEGAAFQPARITADQAMIRDSAARLGRSWELLRQTTPDSV